MSNIKIVALAGSTRKDSFNKLFLRSAVGLAKGFGAQVNVVDLAEYKMPLYDGDSESENGLPDAGAKFKQVLDGADAFIISSPEYNASMSAVLKNSIDWASRPGGVEGSVFAGKPALLISASPGGLGGLRGLNHLRDVLTNLGVFPYNKQQALSAAYQAFDDEGNLKDSSVLERLSELVEGFLSHARKVRS
jgi:chromate reductase, NAD(P)H dehydrogenase (quinone)